MPSETLRADAARNRELLLGAAREAFAELGLDVSLRQIAQRAGVGEPTLRRRFQSKQALVAEAFEDKIGVYAELADRALSEPEPGPALRNLLSQVMSMQLRDRAFTDVLTMTFPPTMKCEQHRRRAYELLGRLIEKAKAAAQVRGDFVAEDVVLMLVAHAGVASGPEPLVALLSARLQALLFQAFGLQPAGPLPPPPSAGRVYHSLLGLHEEPGAS